jgi:prephenate dehydrogenase
MKTTSPLPTPSTPVTLAQVRADIDRLDRALIRLIGRRAALARRAADAAGSAPGRPHRDHPREAEVVRRATELARDLGIAEEPVRGIFWQLIEISHLGPGVR